jgi:predicted RND superfamily exporter protein
MASTAAKLVDPPASPEVSPAPPSVPPAPRVLQRIAQLQLARPIEMLIGLLLTAIFCGYLATKLELKTSLGELLPANKRSVQIADKVAERLPSITTFVVAAEGSDNEGLKRFVDALVPEMRKIDKSLVWSVDADVKPTQAFFEDHKLLYAPLDLIEEVRADVERRWDYEVAIRAGNWLDDDDVPPAISEESIKQRVEKRTEQAASVLKTDTGGYYLDPKAHLIAVRVITPVSSGDLVRTEALEKATRAAVERVDPKRFDPMMRIGFTGTLLSSAEIHNQIKGDLAHVGVWGISLILAVVLLFFLRIRTLLAMGLTVAVGAAWTFGFAYVAIGHLNSSTGFLFSIIVGNGINFGIIYMARYLEERRSHDVAKSILTAHATTWAATLTVAAAATAAYGSLAITNFRGFKHFGLIGGVGMLLCWLATILFLPPLLVLSERLWPLPPPSGFIGRMQAAYGKPFAFLVARAPRVVVALGLVVTVGASLATYRYVARDPMEYDMNKISNAPSEKPSEVQRLNDATWPLMPSFGGAGVALAVDRIEHVNPLVAALEKRRDSAKRPPFGRVVSIFSLLPDEQQNKIRALGQIRETIERGWKKGYVKEEDWTKLDKLIPKDGLKEIGIADLPAAVAQPFVEVDGTRGRLVYIEQADGRSVWDAHYLIEWADSFRLTELPDGSKIEGSGQSVIFADMIIAIVEDAPRAILGSVLCTLLIILVAFRGKRSSAWVIGSLAVAFVWTIAVLAVAKSRWPWEQGGFALEPLKLNFLNFVALPITVGVGSDYAVNVMKRFDLDGGRDIHAAVAETGGAVVLCSLTTMLGYFALTLSINLAIKSFGIAAAAGEICCVLTAVLLLPACLKLFRRNRSLPLRGRAAEGDQ